jgi:N-acetylglucosamine kinase-like BadF-type ATPase
MRIFAGFDGGGSKTLCALSDGTGRLLGQGRGGPSNYRSCGQETARVSIRASLGDAFKNAGLPPCPLAAAYVASAAIGVGDGEAHHAFFRTCVEADHLVCDGDIVPIWYGAVREAPAVVAIAGTGAVVCLCRPEGTLKVGGWGPLVGDEGSGYDLGRRAVGEALRVWDGRAPRQGGGEALMDAVLAWFGVQSPGGLLKVLYGGNAGASTHTIAGAAPVVFRLYSQGNPIARRLLEHSADEIAEAVGAALARDGTEERFPLVLAGGLLGPEEPLFGLVRARTLGPFPRIHVCLPPKTQAAETAAALALRARGLAQAAEKLLQSAADRCSL